MKFAAHYLPTYIPDLDVSFSEFYRKMFEQMEVLDQIGFDQLWVTEHHFNYYGGALPSPSTFLSAVAARTRRIRLGIAVVVLPLHEPLQVAESYAMVDIISGGRLDFGVGRGSTMSEFRGFGLGYEDSPMRLRECMEIIQQAWSDDPVDFHGELFNYSNVRVLPKPIQRPHPPVWVGASRSDATFEWAGAKGFNLLVLPYMYEASVLQRWIGIYKDELVKAGHDPAQKEILGKCHIYVADSDKAALAEAGYYLERYWETSLARNQGDLLRPPGGALDFASQQENGTIIAGDPQRCIEGIRRWQEALGLTTISGHFWFGGMPQEQALKSIRLFADKVMPAFERAEAPA